MTLKLILDKLMEDKAISASYPKQKRMCLKMLKAVFKYNGLKCVGLLWKYDPFCHILFCLGAHFACLQSLHFLSTATSHDGYMLLLWPEYPSQYQLLGSRSRESVIVLMSCLRVSHRHLVGCWIRLAFGLMQKASVRVLKDLLGFVVVVVISVLLAFVLRRNLKNCWYPK